jgi:transmembrane sensor
MSGPRAAAQDGSGDQRPRVRPEVAAEAAVWVARLHGPDRSVAMERECLAWQARSAEHREAFERCTETWQDVPRVSLASAFAGAGTFGERADGGSRRPFRWAAAAAVVLVGAALLVQQWREEGVYGTGVGEQRQVLLDDGTHMSLNTGTRVRVDMGSERRIVDVAGGEALFEVGKDPRRPFVVRVAGSEVEALGTTFAVRFTPDDALPGRTLTVTLIEGQVAVRSLPGGGAAGRPAPGQVVRLEAGERVRLGAASAAAGNAPRVDRPNIDAIMAWKRSEAVFDDVTLPDAVAEMNRYTRTPIVLRDASALAGLRVSGLYRTSDSAGFARAVAALHGLSVHEESGRLELAKPQ